MRDPQRLSRSGDVRRVLRSGRRRQGRLVDVRSLDRGDTMPSRITVIAGRRVGNAVERNRAKRRIRAAIRETTPHAGHDVVVIAKPGSGVAPYAQLREAISSAMSPRTAASEWRTRG